MAIKIQYAMLSLSASVDQQTGSLSVFDLLEELQVSVLPSQLQSLVISLILEKKDQPEFNGKLMIHIIPPDGKQQVVGTGDMRIPENQRRMKAVFRFGGFGVAQTGLHRFVISCIDHRGTKISEALLDFDVVQVSQSSQNAGQQLQ